MLDIFHFIFIRNLRNGLSNRVEASKKRRVLKLFHAKCKMEYEELKNAKLTTYDE